MEKPSLKLQGRGTTRDYRYLRHGAPLTPAEAEAHAAGLGRTRDALGALHLGTEVLPKLLRIVSAALALGNVTFRPAGDGSEVQDAAPLIDACALLGLDPDAAADALLSHAKKIGADMIVLAHSPTEAGALRDALATAAYCRLFEWVLREGCEAMDGLARATEAADAARRRRTSSAFPAATSAVGVLDIFGFESFTTNSLEQLLINFATEKLQAQYVSLVLTLEQREYLDQQLTVEAVEVPQTDHALRLLEDPMGVLSLLDEQLRLGDRGSDANLTLALQRAHSSHAAMAGVRPPHGADDGEFTLRHYAGEVRYAAGGFLRKSRDELQPELIALLATSTDDLVRALAAPPPTPASTPPATPTVGATPSRRPSAATPSSALSTGRRRMRGGESRASAFKVELTALVRRMAATRCRYVRCVNPRRWGRRRRWRPEGRAACLRRRRRRRRRRATATATARRSWHSTAVASPSSSVAWGRCRRSSWRGAATRTGCRSVCLPTPTAVWRQRPPTPPPPSRRRARRQSSQRAASRATRAPSAGPKSSCARARCRYSKRR